MIDDFHSGQAFKSELPSEKIFSRIFLEVIQSISLIFNMFFKFGYKKNKKVKLTLGAKLFITFRASLNQ